jgi:hypothetical protein
MSANSAISWKPFRSDLSVRGAFQLTQGSREERARGLGLRPIAASTSCWRSSAVAVVLVGAQLFLRTA